jgi:MIP family channel proteins
MSNTTIGRFSKYIAEGTGTFCLVFAGCCAIVVNQIYGGALGQVGISFVFGLIVMVMIYSLGDISGAHINPAVTLSFMLARRIGIRQGFIYIASQAIGGILAAGLLRLLFPGQTNLGMTLPASGTLQSFGMEVVMTFLLMFVILNVSIGHKEKGIMAGVAIGGLVAVDALIGGPVSGASMNPARSLGPAIISGEYSGLWIYLTAPFIGAGLALPVFGLLKRNHNPDAPRGS